MSDLEISLGLLFVFCSLLMVVGIFLFVWLYQRAMNREDEPSRFDAGEWLLRGLFFLALVVLLGSVLLLLGEYSFHN